MNADVLTPVVGPHPVHAACRSTRATPSLTHAEPAALATVSKPAHETRCAAARATPIFPAISWASAYRSGEWLHDSVRALLHSQRTPRDDTRKASPRYPRGQSDGANHMVCVNHRSNDTAPLSARVLYSSLYLATWNVSHSFG